jgi:hypothetical protein
MESNNVRVCEAVNCFAYATTKLVLHVGNKGTIAVNVCEDCAKIRFGYTTKEEEEEELGDNNVQQTNI